MAKAELQGAQAAYHESMAAARAAVASGRFAEAVSHAIAAWEHVDGMMKYERKYEQAEFDSLPCVDLVLEHAPLLLDAASLDRMAALLKAQRGVERHTGADLGARLEEARKLLRTAHRLWDHIERNPNARQDELRERLGGDQDEWRWLAERWEAMGLLRRYNEGQRYTLRLVTQLADHARAKCPACGAIAKAPKRRFLEPQKCPRCHATAMFVIQYVPEADSKED